MFTFKKLATAVALVAATGAAHASLVTGATGAVATDDAELFFIAYDPTTQHTLVKDTGYTYSYIAANANNTSWFSSINLGAQVTPGTGAGSFNFSEGLQWNLAVGIRNVSVLGTDNNGAFGTINLATSSNPAQANLQGATTFNAARNVLSQLEVKITGKAQSINTYYNYAGYPLTTDNALIIEDDPTQNDSFTKAWGINFNFGLGGGINNSGTIGESLAFYHWYLQSGPNRVVSDVLPGLFTLSTSGVLSYAAAAPAEVPVPAAAWLFGSALAGLGAIRRKKS